MQLCMNMTNCATMLTTITDPTVTVQDLVPLDALFLSMDEAEAIAVLDVAGCIEKPVLQLSR